MENDLANSLKMFYESNEHRYIDQFFRDTYSLGYRSAFYITHNKDDAEDVLQISYHVILESKNKCQAALEGNHEKTKSWFLSIVLNHARMLIRAKERKMKREKKISESQRRAVQDAGFDSGDESLLNAIKKLPEKYRTPLFLKYYEGLENERISEVLSIKRTTLRSILKRGIDQLRDILSEPKYVKSSAIIIAIKALNFNNAEAGESHLSEFVQPEAVFKMELLLSHVKKVAFFKIVAVYISIIGLLGLSLPAYEILNGHNNSLIPINEIRPKEEWPKVFDKTNWETLGINVLKGKLEIKDGNLMTDHQLKVWFNLKEMPNDPFVIKFDLIAYSKNKNYLDSVISGYFKQIGDKNFGDLNYYENSKFKSYFKRKNMFPYRNIFHGLKLRREILFNKNEMYILENGKPINKQRVENNDGSKLAYGVFLDRLDVTRIQIDIPKKEYIEKIVNQPYKLVNSNLVKGKNYKSIYPEENK